jgi:hypothetical protein
MGGVFVNEVDFGMIVYKNKTKAVSWARCAASGVRAGVGGERDIYI